MRSAGHTTHTKFPHKVFPGLGRLAGSSSALMDSPTNAFNVIARIRGFSTSYFVNDSYFSHEACVHVCASERACVTFPSRIIVFVTFVKHNEYSSNPFHSVLYSTWNRLFHDKREPPASVAVGARAPTRERKAKVWRELTWPLTPIFSVTEFKKNPSLKVPPPTVPHACLALAIDIAF